MEIVPAIGSAYRGLSTIQKARLGYEVAKKVWSKRDMAVKALRKMREWRKNSKPKYNLPSSNGAVTRYKTIANQSKKRRFSRKAWKRSSKFRKRVLAAINNEQNPQYFRFSNIATGSCLSDRQGIVLLGMLGSYDGVASQDDMYNIRTSLDPVALQKESGAASGVYTSIFDRDDSYFTVKSSRALVDFRNAGATDISLDVYALTCKRTSTGFTNISNMLSTGSLWWKGQLSNGNAGADTVGITPYQMPDLLHHFKITGVTRYQVQAGTSISMSMGTKRFVKMDGGDLKAGSDKSPCYPGFTKLLVGVVRGSPGTADGKASAASWANNFTRVYNVSCPINIFPETATTLANNA